MDLLARFRVNNPAVIGESIDGELLIVNLETGAYFSARGSGELIWSLAATGLGMGEIANTVAAAFSGDGAEIRAATLSFIENLVSEGLIVVAPAGDLRSGAVPPTAEPLPFALPVLEKFTDMQELLLLDPVHEVEETGWPHARPEFAAAGEVS